uniref:Choline transporter-like protein n=1 Tax=Naja naja TaxID=35670 RepID=A0A8C6V9T6_NAJNA
MVNYERLIFFPSSWLYGDPRQVIYPRNSTGSYCGIGDNRGKPYLLYFNLMQCVVEANPLAIAMKGLQCPTPQICVSSCPSKFWSVLPTDLVPSSKKPSDVWNQTMCQPSIDLETTKLTMPQLLWQSRDWLYRSNKLCWHTFALEWRKAHSTVFLYEFSYTKVLSLASCFYRQLLNSLNVKEISVKIFEDFTRTWSWILIGLLLAMLLSLLFLLLLRYVAGILVWILIVGLVSIIAYGIYHCYTEYDMLKKKGATIQTIGLTAKWSSYGSVKETWMVALIVLCVAEAILLLSLVFLRNRIFIAIALIKEASHAIGHMMSTLIYPLLTFILIVICVAYWGMTALYLATSGEPLFRVAPTNHSDPGCEKYRGNESCKPLDFNASASLPCITECIFYRYNDEGLYQRNLFNLQIYNIVGFLWCINFVIALGQCVLAGAFASYYWAFNKPQDIPACALPSSFLRTLRFHIGSLAFGSLILTIVQLIRIVLEYLDHKLKDSGNPVAKFFLCCLKCCFWCLEKFLKFLNRNAYIMIAIYGKNFCVSAKNAFNLLMRNVMRVTILDKVTDLLLLFGKLLVVGGIGTLSFFFFTRRIPIENPKFKSPVLNYYWLPILTVVVGSYLIAQGFFSVYNMCVDTLFLCFLEDLERNDGSQEKPYYMSKSLMKILNKKNKKAKDK